MEKLIVLHLLAQKVINAEVSCGKNEERQITVKEKLDRKTKAGNIDVKNHF